MMETDDGIGMGGGKGDSKTTHQPRRLQREHSICFHLEIKTPPHAASSDAAPTCCQFLLLLLLMLMLMLLASPLMYGMVFMKAVIFGHSAR